MTVKSFSVQGVPTVRVEDTEELHGLDLVDVRRPDEFTGELGHIRGAVLKTLGPELDAHLASADRSRPILFICRSGVRSATATTKAMEMGFKHVFNMEGGMLGWHNKKLPIE